MHRTANWDFSNDAKIKHFEWGIAAIPWPPKRYGLPRKMPFYPDQWMVFKGQKYPKEAWALQSWMAGPEGMRIWAQSSGAMPARKSLEEAARTMLKGWKRDITKAETQVMLSSVNYGHVTPSRPGPAVHRRDDLRTLRTAMMISSTSASVSRGLTSRLSARPSRSSVRGHISWL